MTSAQTFHENTSESVPHHQLSEAETLKRIQRYISSPPENSRIFTVSPNIAEIILQEYNKGNRGKKLGKIEEYATDIERGRWMLTGDTIKFSDAGLLRDGQNRLEACIRANKPLTSHFVFGVPDEAFSKMDQGRNRSGGDVLHIAGYTDTHALSAALRWAMLLDEGRAKSRASISPDDALRLVRHRFAGMPEFVKQAGRIYQTTGQPRGLVAALLYMFDKRNSTKAKEWAKAWENGQDGGKFRPMAAATKKIQEIKTLSAGRVHDVVRAALLIKAWNLFVEGKRAAKGTMEWSPSDEFPEILG